MQCVCNVLHTHQMCSNPEIGNGSIRVMEAEGISLSVSGSGSHFEITGTKCNQRARMCSNYKGNIRMA